jgi:predicted RNA binding protein YcfA (HicA-like mRNA interferase family)
MKYVLCGIIIMQGGNENANETYRNGKMILADGWIFRNQEGSHRNYVHPTKPGKVTIPFHKGKDLNIKTENSIKKQAGLK